MGAPRLFSATVTEGVNEEADERSHKTSIRLEDVFWTALRQIARERAMTVSPLIAAIQRTRDLLSAVRVIILDHYRYNAMCRHERAASHQRDRRTHANGGWHRLRMIITETPTCAVSKAYPRA